VGRAFLPVRRVTRWFAPFPDPIVRREKGPRCSTQVDHFRRPQRAAAWEPEGLHGNGQGPAAAGIRWTNYAAREPIRGNLHTRGHPPLSNILTWPTQANLSCTTTSFKGSWPGLGQGSLVRLPTAIMKLMT
jgi:hypothetical protein